MGQNRAKRGGGKGISGVLGGVFGSPPRHVSRLRPDPPGPPRAPPGPTCLCRGFHRSAAAATPPTEATPPPEATPAARSHASRH